MHKRKVAENMEQKNFFKELFRPENKKARLNIFTAFVIGVLLLMMGNTFLKKPESQPPVVLGEGEKTQSSQEGSPAEKQLEKRMKAILSKIEGAGEVDVMITMGETSQMVVARNEKSEASTVIEEGENGPAKTTQSEKLENAVVMTEDGKGATNPLVLSQISPQVTGVIIVAQGGGDVLVQEKLMAAAQALLDVPAHKVAILKMK